VSAAGGNSKKQRAVMKAATKRRKQRGNDGSDSDDDAADGPPPSIYAVASTVMKTGTLFRAQRMTLFPSETARLASLFLSLVAPGALREQKGKLVAVALTQDTAVELQPPLPALALSPAHAFKQAVADALAGDFAGGAGAAGDKGLARDFFVLLAPFRADADDHSLKQLADRASRLKDVAFDPELESSAARRKKQKDKDKQHAPLVYGGAGAAGAGAATPARNASASSSARSERKPQHSQQHSRQQRAPAFRDPMAADYRYQDHASPRQQLPVLLDLGAEAVSSHFGAMSLEDLVAAESYTGADSAGGMSLAAIAAIEIADDGKPASASAVAGGKAKQSDAQALPFDFGSLTSYSDRQKDREPALPSGRKRPIKAFRNKPAADEDEDDNEDESEAATAPFAAEADELESASARAAALIGPAESPASASAGAGAAGEFASGSLLRAKDRVKREALHAAAVRYLLLMFACSPSPRTP
jgi:hypothetical protein